MNQIDFLTIYLICLFILPGFVAYSIYTSLYKHSKAESDWTLLLKSLLHSGLIYLIIYFLYRLTLRKIPSLPIINNSLQIQTLLSNQIICLTLILLSISVFWGLILFWTASCKPLLVLLKFFKIEQELRPPNLYATILEPRYNPKAADGYWLIFPHDNKVKMGHVEFTDVCDADRLVWITGLKLLNEDRQVISQYPESAGIILDLTKTEWFEVLYPD